MSLTDKVYSTLKKPVVLAPTMALAGHYLWHGASEFADRLNLSMAMPDKRSYASNVLGTLDYLIDAGFAFGANHADIFVPWTAASILLYIAFKKVKK